jgi:hypothetical protein
MDFNPGSDDFQASIVAIDELELNAGFGDFSLKNVSGEIESNTVSGDLELEEIAR